MTNSAVIKNKEKNSLSKNRS